MDIEIGRGKTARRAYGLDEIAIVPSRRTRDPEDVDISWSLGNLNLDLPCLASALDAAVDPTTAGIIGSLGGLAVLNLEGLQTRYEDPGPVFEEIARLRELLDGAPPHADRRRRSPRRCRTRTHLHDAGCDRGRGAAGYGRCRRRSRPYAPLPGD